MKNETITAQFRLSAKWAGYCGILMSISWPLVTQAEGDRIFNLGLALNTQSLQYIETSRSFTIQTINLNPTLYTRIQLLQNRLFWDSSITYSVFSSSTPKLGQLVALSGLTLYIWNNNPGFMLGMGGGGVYFRHLTDTIEYGIQSVMTSYAQILLHINTTSYRRWELNSRLILLSMTGFGIGTNSVWNTDLIIPFWGNREGSHFSLLVGYEKANYSTPTASFVYHSNAYSAGLRFGF